VYQITRQTKFLPPIRLLLQQLITDTVSVQQNVNTAICYCISKYGNYSTRSTALRTVTFCNKHGNKLYLEFTN